MVKFKNTSAGEVSFKLAGVRYTVLADGEVLIPERYEEVLQERIARGLSLERVNGPDDGGRPSEPAPTAFEQEMLRRLHSLETRIGEKLAAIEKEQHTRLSRVEEDVADLKNAVEGEVAAMKSAIAMVRSSLANAPKSGTTKAGIPATDTKPPAGAPAPQ